MAMRGNMRSKKILPVVLVVTGVGAGAAWAQQIDEATRQRARRAWSEAMTAYDAERYEEALAGFRVVHDLTRRPEALLNMGYCYYFLIEPAQAMTYLSRARTALGDALDPATARDIETKMARLRDKIGTLRIVVNVDDAEVQVGGEVVGRSPLAEPVYVLPGTVTVRATGPGGVARQVSAVAERGREVTVTVELPAELPVEVRPDPVLAPLPGPEPPPPPPPVVVPAGPGRMRVECPIAGALVAVAGRDPTPAPWEEELDAGIYQVEVLAEGYHAYRDAVQVRPDSVTTVRASLLRADPDALDPLWFWVGAAVTGVFAGATIGTGLAAESYYSDADEIWSDLRFWRDEYVRCIDLGNPGGEPCSYPDRDGYVRAIDGLKSRYTDANDTAVDLETATWVLLGVTAAAAGATIYLLLESEPLFGGSDANVTFAPVPTSDGIALGAWGRF